jgi:hypothetical protein
MDIRHEATHSNFVRVVDIDCLEKALEPFEIEIANGKNENEGKVCFIGCCKGGGFPNWIWNADGEELEFTFEEYVVPYLAEGEALVTIHGGTNGFSLVSGYLATFQKDKPAVYLPLSDISNLASIDLEVDRLIGFELLPASVIE